MYNIYSNKIRKLKPMDECECEWGQFVELEKTEISINMFSLYNRDKTHTHLDSIMEYFYETDDIIDNIDKDDIDIIDIIDDIENEYSSEYNTVQYKYNHKNMPIMKIIKTQSIYPFMIFTLGTLGMLSIIL